MKDQFGVNFVLDRFTPSMAQEYAAYHAAHHDLLVRYIRTVWLRLPS